ncbi:DUF535 family protein [Ideonella sp. B508-1]|uniref:DUF535 family protein n=1 Tax=Ideonella sp. B508-1 TaxID=137716 RepID=UPI0003B5845C|nr:DUF535 family protein [Ideonella sp. B508-1]
MNAIPIPIGEATDPGPHAKPEGATALQWPSLLALLRHMRTSPVNLGRMVSVGLAYVRARALRPGLEQQLRGSTLLGVVLQRGTEAFTPLVRELADRRLSLSRRFEVFAHSVLGTEQMLSAAALRELHQGRRVVLLSHEDCQIDLGPNEYSMEEGLWSVTLRGAQGVRLSSVSFSVLPGQRLMLGCVQGPKLSEALALDEIRRATHAFHGLRPPHVVLAVLKVLARLAGQQLLGVDLHVKARLRRRLLRSSYHFDYRAFWGEQGGTLNADGHWVLPLDDGGQRLLSEVPSKKRSMYRRRNELLASLPLRLQPHLAPSLSLALERAAA